MELVRPVFLLCFLLLREGDFALKMLAAEIYFVNINLEYVQPDWYLVIGHLELEMLIVGCSDIILKIHI